MEAKESLSSFADNAVRKRDLCTEFGRTLGKAALIEPSEEQYELLLSRLKQQLGEGRGEVILEVRERKSVFYLVYIMLF